MLTPHKPAPPKRDIEKFGVFKADGYLREIDYIPLDNFKWNESVHKDKQMLCGTVSAKRKDGTNNGYFSGFIRIFEGEAPTDPLKEYRKERKEKCANLFAGQFLPSSPAKKRSGAGDNHGTFSGHIEAFSPAKRSINKLNVWGEKLKKKPFRFKQPGRGGYGSVVECICQVGRVARRIQKCPAVTGHNSRGGATMYLGCVDITIDRYPTRFEPDSLRRPKLREPGCVDTSFWDYYSKPPCYINKNPYYLHRTQVIRAPKQLKNKPKSGPLSGHKEFKPCGPGPSLGGCKAGCFTHFSKYGFSSQTASTRKPYDRAKRPIPFLSSVPNSTAIYRSIVQTNVDKKVTSKSYNSVDGVMYKTTKTLTS